MYERCDFSICAEEPFVKIYIAAPFPLKNRAINLMRDLTAQGFEITSRWLFKETKMSDSVEENKGFATTDLEDVVKSHIFLLLNPPEWINAGTGGRHTELGFSFAIGKPIYILGVRSNVFHSLDGIEVFDTYHEVLDALNKLRREFV